eukprot:scaffold3418_cov124-Isochrysis_galbana.AAC.9
MALHGYIARRWRPAGRMSCAGIAGMQHVRCGMYSYSSGTWTPQLCEKSAKNEEPTGRSDIDIARDRARINTRQDTIHRLP